jgi:tRNA (adenine37-N6)-methyltransferase
MKIQYNAIGMVHTPFKDLNEIPKQPGRGKGIEGRIEIYPEYQQGLRDLDGFSHIILLCHFHKVTDFHLNVIPSGRTESRGLFATRTPRRPNPIGFSVVRLLSVEENRLEITDLDILDGTPLLDIKPYFHPLEAEDVVKTGWF